MVNDKNCWNSIKMKLKSLIFRDSFGILVIKMSDGVIRLKYSMLYGKSQVTGDCYMKKFLFLLLIVALTGTANATPTFYLSPGTNPNNDISFQSSVSGLDFHEEDFNKYKSGQIISDITLGNVNIDISLPSSGLSYGECFRGGYSGTKGGVYGTVSGGALMNSNRVTGNNNISESVMFTFDGDRVKGFGIWVFDDTAATIDSFRMIVEGLDGQTWTSGILDANPGTTAHQVEGFIGVTLDAGIKNISIMHIGNKAEIFELDHLQIASSPAVIPAPSALLLVSLGVSTIGFLRRKRAL